MNGDKMLDKPARGFTLGEFEERLQRAQKLMAKNDMAGILLMSEPEVRYFSGFNMTF